LRNLKTNEELLHNIITKTAKDFQPELTDEEADAYASSRFGTECRQLLARFDGLSLYYEERGKIIDDLRDMNTRMMETFKAFVIGIELDTYDMSNIYRQSKYISSGQMQQDVKAFEEKQLANLQAMYPERPDPLEENEEDTDPCFGCGWPHGSFGCVDCEDNCKHELFFEATMANGRIK
jgi:hypothetical protein